MDMTTTQELAAGPSLRVRLPPVEEESEVGSDVEEYSDAGSVGGSNSDGDLDTDDRDTSFESYRSANGVDEKGKGVDLGSSTRLPTRSRSSSVTKEKESRSWSDLDPSMVVALVSPIGNWLTGSDHVKNLFLLLLLIFYLHQLIEGLFFRFRCIYALNIEFSALEIVS